MMLYNTVLHYTVNILIYVNIMYNVNINILLYYIYYSSIYLLHLLPSLIIFIINDICFEIALQLLNIIH